MKYFVIKFGSVATNLAVAVATTPTKYKGHRFNASAASHQLDSNVRRQDPATLQWGYVEQEKPFTAYPQDGVLQELTRDEYIRDAIDRASRVGYNRLTPAEIRERVVSELDIIEKRAQGIKNAI